MLGSLRRGTVAEDGMAELLRLWWAGLFASKD